MEKANAQRKADRQARIEELKQLENEAETDQEKEDFQTQREDLEAQPLPKGFFPKWESDIRMIAYGWADLVSCLLLNILLLIAGIGLLGYRDWARKLSLLLAGVKILRLLVLYGYFVAVVVPLITKQMELMMEQQFRQMEQMQKQMNPPGGGGRPVPAMPAGMGKQMAIGYGVFFSCLAIAMMILGSIYPGVSLWLLSRPAVRIACQSEDSFPGTG